MEYVTKFTNEMRPWRQIIFFLYGFSELIKNYTRFPFLPIFSTFPILHYKRETLLEGIRPVELSKTFLVNNVAFCILILW